MMLHGLCVGEEAGARNLVFFRVNWLQPAMKGTSFVRRLRLRSFLSRIVPPMCFATSGCSCVRSSMRFLELWLQIALEWLHDCCHVVLLCADRDSGFEDAVSEAVARSSIVFCNSVAADRIGMPASRLLGAAAACVILLSFAAEHRKPYWGGCIQAAIALCQHNMSQFWR